MVFVGGPRQVGKTTPGPSLLAPDGSADESRPAYLSLDDPGDRFARWRSLVKGLYDGAPHGRQDNGDERGGVRRVPFVRFRRKRGLP